MARGRPSLMEEGQGTPAGWAIVDDIRANLQEVEPRTKADKQLYAEGFYQVQRLADARKMCLVAAEEGIPGVLWVVLVFGGAAIGFTYLFGLGSTWAHRLMVVTLAGVIGLVLFTVGALHRRGPGASLLRRHAHRHGGLRAGTGEVRDQRAQRPLVRPVSTPMHRSARK